MKKVNQKFTKEEITMINELRRMSGKDFVQILRILGITMNNYAHMVKPPLASASGINYYRSAKKLPFRIILPLIENYPVQFLVNLIQGKITETKPMEKV